MEHFESIESRLTDQMATILVEKFESIFLEGLKLKGYSFDNKFEVEEFVAMNCRCEDIIHLKQRTYFVNDIPFLLHLYEIKSDVNFQKSEINLMSASYGQYSFL